MKNDEMLKTLMSKEKRKELVEVNLDVEKKAKKLSQDARKKKSKKSKLDKNRIRMGLCG